MNAFLNPHNNGPSLTGVTDITVHSISLFQESEEPQNIKNMFIPKSDISVVEPYDIQVDETGNNIITMYQFIGEVSDTKVGGLEPLLNYMNESFSSKGDPAINEHHYHITENNTMKRYILFTMPIKTKHLILRTIINITKNITNNTENVLNDKDCSYKTDISNIYISQIAYVENNLYKRFDNRVFNNTNIMSKHITQYPTDAFNNYNIK